MSVSSPNLLFSPLDPATCPHYPVALAQLAARAPMYNSKQALYAFVRSFIIVVQVAGLQA